jgi:hypothetical protein
VVDVRQHDCQIAIQIAAGGAQRSCADRPSARAAVMGWLIRPPTRPAKTVVLLSDPFPLSDMQDAGQCIRVHEQLDEFGHRVLRQVSIKYLSCSLAQFSENANATMRSTKERLCP